MFSRHPITILEEKKLLRTALAGSKRIGDYHTRKFIKDVLKIPSGLLVRCSPSQQLLVKDWIYDQWLDMTNEDGTLKEGF